ncbi:MAG: hypothetical protein ACI9FJ_002800 [Alteromonadaceae bacterium]|jgi:hypothetical protein
MTRLFLFYFSSTLPATLTQQPYNIMHTFNWVMFIMASLLTVIATIVVLYTYRDYKTKQTVTSSPHNTDGSMAQIMDAIAVVADYKQQFTNSKTANEFMQNGKEMDSAVEQLLAIANPQPGDTPTDGKVNFKPQ